MKKVLLWIVAFLITAFSAVYQRVTGPTYPLRGKISFGESEISYTLARSHETGQDYEIRVNTLNPDISGFILYKKHKTADPWTKAVMAKSGETLTARLPHQPPAGKLDYSVILRYKGKEVSLTGDKAAVIRFKGSVPDFILIPHILFMFLAMLFSTRAGLEALSRKGNPRKLALWALGLLFIGGMIFGPLVQKFAFGEFWTGLPFGFDLTDNKTLIALIGWIAAVIAGRKEKPARGWVLGASILLLLVFLIPHSVLGSELDYSKINAPASSFNSHFEVPGSTASWAASLPLRQS